MGGTAGVRIDGAPVDAAVRAAGPAGDDPSAPDDAAAVPRPRRRSPAPLVVALLAVLIGLSTAVRHWRIDAIAGEGRAGLIRGVYPCPQDRNCAVSPQPSQLMWAAAYEAFPGYNEVSTTVMFDASTGATYGQSMTLTKDGIVVRLTVSRDLWSRPREMFVDVTTASSEGVVVTAVPADGVLDRMSTAALSGPEDALLPVDAAILWATTLDLFGDGPR